jgi:RNA polymerase sigma factor (sigma-70 family)
MDTTEMLGSLFRQNRRRWLSYMIRFVGYQDAEDVVQDTICRVLRLRRSFENQEDLRLYLSRSLHTRAITAGTKIQRNRRRHVQLVEVPGSGDPETAFQSKQRELLVRQILDRTSLPPHQYQALIAVMGREDTVRGCAESLGVPYSTLRHRASVALRKLRRSAVKSRLL